MNSGSNSPKSVHQSEGSLSSSRSSSEDSATEVVRTSSHRHTQTPTSLNQASAPTQNQQSLIDCREETKNESEKESQKRSKSQSDSSDHQLLDALLN
jgi:hypothetical protein